MECSICNVIKQPIRNIKNPLVSCDSCRNTTCIECSELSTSELRCIALQKRTLKYNCKKCRNYELSEILQKTITDKEKIINEQEMIINLLKEKIENLEKISKPSYASVLQQEIPFSKTMKTNLPTIIVKPKQQQSPDQIKKDLDTNINPAELKIGVTNVKLTKFGNMIIKCQTKNEVEILRQALDNKLKNRYDIELSKLRQPRIKIVKVMQDFTPEVIEKYLKEQNNITGEAKVKYIRQNRNGSKTIICECTPNAFHQIINLKKICLGWERYMVYEDLSVPRCYNCQGYFHKKSECKNKIVCPICSDEHEERMCPNQKKMCKNCELSNQKYNTNYATDHQNNSLECPVLKFHTEVLKSKINYIIE